MGHVVGTERLEDLAGQARYRALWFLLCLFPLAIPLLQGEVYYDVSHIYRAPMFSGPDTIQNNDLFDPLFMFYPNQELLRQSVASGQLPWWNPYNFCGAPFVANGQSGAMYPPRLLLLALFDTATVQGLLILGHLFMAGFFMSTLGRTFSLSGSSSVFLGTTGMLCGFVTAELELGIAAGCSAWIPVLLLLVRACPRSWKAVGGLSLATAIFITQGHLQYVLGSLLLVLFFGLYLLLREKGGLFAVGRAALAAFLGVCMASPLLVPTAVNLLSGSRGKFPLGTFIEVHRRFLESSLSTFIYPEMAGSPVTHFSFLRMPYGATFCFWETVVFAGSLTFILALVGMFQRGIPRFAAFLGLMVLFVPATRAYLLVQKLPGFDRSYPARYLLLFHFCLVICAAFGLESLTEKRFRWTGLLGFLGAGYGLYTMYFQVNFGRLWLNHGIANNTIRLPRPYGSRTEFSARALAAFQETYAWTNPSFLVPLSVLLIGALLILSRRSPWLLVFLTAGELLYFTCRWNPTSPREALFPSNEATIFLKEHVGQDRVLNMGAFSSNTLRPYRIPSVGGYDSFIQGSSVPYLEAIFPKKTRYAGFPQVVGSWWLFDPRLLNLAGVRYIVTPPTRTMKDLPLVHKSTVSIYENSYRAPRVFLVGKQRIVEDAGATVELISEGSVNPFETVLLATEPSELFQEEVRGKARLISSDLNEVKVEVTTENRAWMVLTDAYEPSWEARIDGDPVPIYRAYGLFRAIEVKPGTHTVVFRYRPFRWPQTTALASLALIVVVLLLSPLSSRKPETEEA